MIEQQAPSGSTVVAGVVGDPIAHSLSPTLHNAAFAALGLDWVFVALRVPSQSGETVVASMRCLELRGLSVTMPHKQAVARTADRRTEDVERLGAANNLHWDNGSIVAANTDGAGLLGSLAEVGFDPKGRAVIVVGAGGAARASVLALASAGAREIGVVARRSEPARQAASLAGSVGRVAAEGDIASAELVVQATPVGMSGGPAPEQMPFAPELLRPGQLLVDLIYGGEATPLLRSARERGIEAVNGEGMLLHQAAVAFELWTGTGAPLEAMRLALGSAHT